MRSFICLLLVVTARCEEPGTSSQTEVVVLNSENFEHETQVTTGATTGDWFVKFYAPWCGHCKALAPAWEEVAVELKEGGRINVAKVDVTKSPQLGKRFDIKGFPTLILFSKGKMYEYQASEEWPRDKEHLVKFAEESYKSFEWELIPLPISRVEEFKKITSEFVSILIYYSSHLNEIEDNEWGFLIFGIFGGGLMSLVTYFFIGTIMGPADVVPVEDKKKK